MSKFYDKKPNAAIQNQVRNAREQDKKRTVTKIQEYKKIKNEYTKQALKKTALAGVSIGALFVPGVVLPAALVGFGAVQLPGLFNALSKRADVNDKLQAYKTHKSIIESNERSLRH